MDLQTKSSMLTKGINIGDRGLSRFSDTHPDWSAAFANLYNHELIGASALGKLHIRDKTPRDDAFAIKTSGEWAAIAVSDGLGSHKNSRYGSTFAVQMLSEMLLTELRTPQDTSKNEINANAINAKNKSEKSKSTIRKFLGHLNLREKKKSTFRNEFYNYSFPIQHVAISPQDCSILQIGNIQWYDKELYELSIPVSSSISLKKIMTNSFDNTHNQLMKYAKQLNLDKRDLGCTLLGMLMNLRTGAFVVGQVGDGMIAGLKKDNTAEPLLNTDIPEEGGGATYVITSSGWEGHFSCKEYSKEQSADFRTFFIMSDGVENDCTNPPPEDIFNRWARDVDRELRKEIPIQEKSAMLLNWLANYTAPGSWDDRTLVVVLKENTEEKSKYNLHKAENNIAQDKLKRGEL